MNSTILTIAKIAVAVLLFIKGRGLMGFVENLLAPGFWITHRLEVRSTRAQKVFAWALAIASVQRFIVWDGTVQNAFVCVVGALWASLTTTIFILLLWKAVDYFTKGKQPD